MAKLNAKKTHRVRKILLLRISTFPPFFCLLKLYHKTKNLRNLSGIQKISCLREKNPLSEIHEISYLSCLGYLKNQKILKTSEISPFVVKFFVKTALFNEFFLGGIYLFI